MMPKFRFYVILTICSGIVFFALYKVLRTEEKENEINTLEQQHSSHMVSNKIIPSNIPKSSEDAALRISTFDLSPMKNVNELLPITMSTKHLLKQRLREAEVHAKILETTLKRQLSTGEPENLSNFNVKNHPKLKHKLIHLDLKGAPPSVKYYSKFFPLIKKMDATGILIEYEDMFPFEGKIDNFKAYNSYSKNDIREILISAQENNLEVIPLIQTFGHMEFILKQPQFMHLREVPEYPQVICPSKNETKKVIFEIIDQVVVAHPTMKFLHIGADEVYYLGRCETCQEKLQAEKIDIYTLFIHHVLEVARYIKDTYSIQPIMWDDMFRAIPEDYLRESGINKYVELMVWKYTPNVEDVITSDIWDKYAALFPNIWAASAFKGASRPTSSYTNIEYHLSNHHSWMRVISEYQDKVNFQGIALTGWSRFDHFSNLCELLPAATPSLALNLIYLKEGSVNNSTLDQTKRILDCKDSFNVTWDTRQNEEIRCNFPGSRIFSGIQRLANVQWNLDKIVNNNHVLGWMTDYHVRMKFGSPAHVEIGTRNLSDLITNTTLLYTFMENALTEVYDTYTTREWLETNIDPIVAQLKKLKAKEIILTRPSTWLRRPLIDLENKTNTIKELALLNRQVDL